MNAWMALETTRIVENYYKINKILKIKHSQIIAKIKKTTLREINLDILTE